MRVTQLVADLIAKYPRQADVITSWAPQYRTRLQHAEGMRLQEAFDVTMTGWAGMVFPKPAEIAAHLPGKTAPADNDDIFAQTTREYEQRYEAANAWWKERGHAVEITPAGKIEVPCRAGSLGRGEHLIEHPGVEEQEMLEAEREDVGGPANQDLVEGRRDGVEVTGGPLPECFDVPPLARKQR